jgi:hypothetical protein
MLDRPPSSHRTTTMHGNHPQLSTNCESTYVVAHNRFSSVITLTKYLTAPLNPRSLTAGTHPEGQVSVRQAARQRDIQTGLRPQRHRTRPETHQNLIYPDKEQHIAPSGRNRGRS